MLRVYNLPMSANPCSGETAFSDSEEKTLALDPSTSAELLRGTQLQPYSLHRRVSISPQDPNSRQPLPTAWAEDTAVSRDPSALLSVVWLGGLIYSGVGSWCDFRSSVQATRLWGPRQKAGCPLSDHKSGASLPAHIWPS